MPAWIPVDSTTIKFSETRPFLQHGSDTGKVLSFLEACFDLISSSSLSMKIQILGGKITENQGFKSPPPEGQKKIILFSFYF